MNYTTCPTCHAYANLERHKCAPRWFVQIHEYHDLDDPGSGVKVHAGDAEDAAKLAVEEWDDERTALDDEYLVRVTPLDAEPGSAPEWFTVNAEASVDYYAHEAEPPEDEAAP